MEGRTSFGRRAVLGTALAMMLVPAAMSACGGSTSGETGTGGTVPGPFGGESTDAGTVTERAFQCTVGNGVLNATIEHGSDGERLHLRGFQFVPGSQISVTADTNGDGLPDQTVTGVADANGDVEATALLPGGINASQVNVGTGLCAFNEVTVDAGTPGADAGTGGTSDAGTFFTPAPAPGPHP